MGSLAKFQAKQAALRRRDLIREAISLRDVPGEETMDAAFQLDKLALELAAAGVRKDKGAISERELIKELTVIYWGKRNETNRCKRA